VEHNVRVLSRLQEADVAQLATVEWGIATLLNHKDVGVNTAQVLAHVGAEDSKMLSAISVGNNDCKTHRGILAKECQVGGGDPTWHRDPVGRVGHAALEAVLVSGSKPYTSSTRAAIEISATHDNMILKGDTMAVVMTPRAKAALGLMGESDKYYVIYEPRETWDQEPYCLYGEKTENEAFAEPILRLSFDEVRWIMTERIRLLGGDPTN
jgi:hypothetical protein